MSNSNSPLTAATDRVAQALLKLEAALNTAQEKRGALKEDRDHHKRMSLEEQEKFRGLQSAAFNVTLQLDASIARIDEILKAS